VGSTDRNVCTSLNDVWAFTAPIFHQRHPAGQTFVQNCYTEVHQNWPSGLVAGTGPLTDGRTGVVSTLGFQTQLRKECLRVNKRVIFSCFSECSIHSSGEPFSSNCGWSVRHVGLL
jgi:hypothetical protein